jgi:four helix bundle protein
MCDGSSGANTSPAARIPDSITADPLWKLEAYRLAVEATELGWSDVTRLYRDARTLALSNQLWRCLGSIRANLAEGYSRSSGHDRARFYEYALGSAREAREWYHCAQHILGNRTTTVAMTRLSSIIRLVLTALPYERRRSVRAE